ELDVEHASCCWPRKQHLVPALEVWARRALARQPEPTVHLRTDRDVGDREALAGHERLARQMVVDEREQGFGGGDCRGDAGRVALGGRGAEELHEGITPGGVERGLLPLHPALGIEAQGQRLWIEAARR